MLQWVEIYSILRTCAQPLSAGLPHPFSKWQCAPATLTPGERRPPELPDLQGMVVSTHKHAHKQTGTLTALRRYDLKNYNFAEEGSQTWHAAKLLPWRERLDCKPAWLTVKADLGEPSQKQSPKQLREVRDTCPFFIERTTANTKKLYLIKIHL